MLPLPTENLVNLRSTNRACFLFSLESMGGLLIHKLVKQTKIVSGTTYQTRMDQAEAHGPKKIFSEGSRLGRAYSLYPMGCIAGR